MTVACAVVASAIRSAANVYIVFLSFRSFRGLATNALSAVRTSKPKSPPDEKEHFMKCLVCGEMFDRIMSHFVGCAALAG